MKARSSSQMNHSKRNRVRTYQMRHLGLSFMLCSLAQIMCLSVYSQTCGMSDVSPNAYDQDYCCGKQYDDALSEEQIKAVIRTFCQQALRREVSGVRPLSEPRREEPFQVWRQTYQFSDYKSDENEITVNIQTGFVTYCKLPVRSSVGKNGPLTEEGHAVSIEEAFELAIPILQWYGMPLQPSYYTISEDPDSGGPPDDWRIRGNFNFDGVLCRSRCLDVYVSLHIPEVSGVWCIEEMVPPERHVVTVTRREALQITAKFMAGLPEVRWKRLDYELPDELEDITEIITPPLNMGFSNVKEPTEKGYLAHKLYYAWNVPVILLYDGNRVDGYVSVDTETGEVINGGREREKHVRRASTSQHPRHSQVQSARNAIFRFRRNISFAVRQPRRFFGQLFSS